LQSAWKKRSPPRADVNWKKSGQTCWQSDSGHRVAAFRQALRVYVYGAYAPPIPYAELKEKSKTHYALGETVPTACEPLGFFDDPAHARACAERHQKQTEERNAESV
jgi:hypothetical protein